MKSQCEALVTGKQQKMSMLQSFKQQHDGKIFLTANEKKGTSAYNEVSLFIQMISAFNVVNLVTK